MTNLLLMHGTCSCKADKIRESGLNANSFLTNDESVADYYADVAHDECGCGDYEIIKVLAPIKSLKVDYNSFEEPLSLFRNNFTHCDREWHDMIESGEIPYPSSDKDFQTSLDVVTSVVCSIPLNDIKE